MQYVNKVSNIAAALTIEKFIMKSKTAMNLDADIKTIRPMREFLNSIGKEAEFTSDVYHVTLNDNSQWVLKLSEEPSIKEFTEFIAEVAAYKISKETVIDLVPKTKLVAYQGKIGSLQKFVGNTLDKKSYHDLLSSNIEKIEHLKLFWFILGQWDSGEENVLFTQEAKPVAIDNANIANIQQVSEYGKPHFVRSFYTDKDNNGSIKEPIVIQGHGSHVSSTLKETFEKEVPQYFIQALAKKSHTSFTYFVENNRIWRNFNDDITIPDYFMEKFSRDNLEKFKSLNFDNIASKLTTKLINSLNSEILTSLETPKEELSQSIQKHFDQVSQGINTRYHLAEDYLNNLLGGNDDEVSYSGELSSAKDINES